MSFELRDPWLLLAGLPFVFLLWRRLRAPRRVTPVQFPTLALVPRAKTWRTRLLPLPAALFALGVAASVFALARPRLGEAKSVVRRDGAALEMLIDRSASMDEPTAYGGEERPKIAVVRDVFARFIAGGDGLKGRPNDLVGLTTFARYPEEVCPLIARHEPILDAVAQLRTVPPFLTRERVPTAERAEAVAGNPLSATAIGDALTRGVLSLVSAEGDLARAGKVTGGASPTLKGKAIILLTDGENNAGSPPLEAARLAAKSGIKVYYVLIASRDMEQETPFGDVVRTRLDDAALAKLMAEPREVAAMTGGKAFFAADGDALRTIYKEIDGLERSDVGPVEYTTHRELFALPLCLAAGALLLGAFMDETILRRIP